MAPAAAREPHIDLTIAIPTRDRADLLDAMLASLAAAFPPRRLAVEDVVVLNACGDASAAVAERRAADLPLAVITEPRAGLSHARNAAVEAARGRFIAWLDDDVLVAPGWLRAYEAAIEAHPDAALFGGPIEPTFVGTPPAWFLRTWRRFDNVFAARSPRGDGPITPDYVPYGANFVVRADLQRAHRFDPVLGRQPGLVLRGGEETALVSALLRDGATGRWVEAAAVRHMVTRERQNRIHLARYFAGQGFEKTLRESPDRAAWLRRQTADARALARLALRFGWLSWRGEPEAWVPVLIEASRTFGRLSGRTRTARRRSAAA
jgi:glycosyltransferase involved in cell wall biosynthesis